MNERIFPVLDEPGQTIPWEVAERAYREYIRRFGETQSLGRIAERGGFARAELRILLGEK